MERILVVEDNLPLNAGLCFELDAAGYASIAAYNCRKAQYLVETEEFSLAVLDVNLPDGNGFELCRRIKERRPELPIVFLTAHDREEDILQGLDMGAEDYVTKPFITSVFVKKVGILLRRSKRETVAGEASFDDGNLLIDLENMVVLKGSEKLGVTPNEYKIIRVLLSNAGNIVSRQVILEKVFDCAENYIDNHTLTVNINRLRNKIEDEEHTYIRTVRGLGYAWIGKMK